jgi:predicted type IV restriction endonuclease
MLRYQLRFKAKLPLEKFGNVGESGGVSSAITDLLVRQLKPPASKAFSTIISNSATTYSISLTNWFSGGPPLDFIDRLKALGAIIPRSLDDVKTEGATKTAFVLPFIQALGYNVFDPSEVVPEFIADVGIKKGEKVDYAVMQDGRPILLFECKHHAINLDHEHASQLHRYFHTTSTRIGVLTNGIEYRFFSDLEEPNKMDSKPFLELNMLEINESVVEEVKKFSKGAFNVEEVVNAATEFKHTREVQRILAENFNNPTDEFVKFFADQVYPNNKRVTAAVKLKFVEFTRRACQQFVSEIIHERLKTVMSHSLATPQTTEVKTLAEAIEEAGEPSTDRETKIVTTQEEIDGFYIIKAIVSEVVDPSRVFMRDTASYCGVLLDDNNRKAICRMHFNGDTKFIHIVGAEKVQERITLTKLTDIFKHAAQLKHAATSYEKHPKHA